MTRRPQASADAGGKRGASTDKAYLFAYYWNLLSERYPPAFAAAEWTREYNFDAHWKRRHRFDFARLDKKVAVEVDGGQFIRNGGRHNTDTDREKLNIAAALGWRVFRFSVQQLERDPQACVDLVAMALKA